jgi:molybdopterin-guanine dinucleotide biosynthesis protein A
MGQDKAMMLFDGQPLVARALGVFKEAGIPASIAGGAPSLERFAPLVTDSTPGLGPLSGICAALASITATRAAFLPVDMPLLPASLLAFLAERACVTGSAVTVAAVSGFAQTFPVVLERAVVPEFMRRLEAGKRGCFSAFEAAAASLGQTLRAVAAEHLAQSGHVEHPDGLPAYRWFLNVNTPVDLSRAEMPALARHRVS